MQTSQIALDYTPEQLKVLKDAGVVDAAGRGKYEPRNPQAFADVGHQSGRRIVGLERSLLIDRASPVADDRSQVDRGLHASRGFRHTLEIPEVSFDALEVDDPLSVG